MRLTGAVLACCLLLLCPHRASAQDHVEVFGGYSFVRASVPITTGFGPCTGPPGCLEHFLMTGNLNGWEVAGTLRPGTWFGITADFSGYYIQTASADAIAAMRQFSESLLCSTCAPNDGNEDKKARIRSVHRILAAPLGSIPHVLRAPETVIDMERILPCDHYFSTIETRAV